MPLCVLAYNSNVDNDDKTILRKNSIKPKLQGKLKKATPKTESFFKCFYSTTMGKAILNLVLSVRKKKIRRGQKLKQRIFSQSHNQK